MKKVIVIERENENVVAKVVKVEDVVGWKFLRNTIENFVEHVSLDACKNNVFKNIGIWCDSEYKLASNWVLDSTLAITSNEGEILEVLAGPLVIAKDDYISGKTYGFEDNEIDYILSNMLSDTKLVINETIKLNVKAI